MAFREGLYYLSSLQMARQPQHPQQQQLLGRADVYKPRAEENCYTLQPQPQQCAALYRQTRRHPGAPIGAGGEGLHPLNSASDSYSNLFIPNLEMSGQHTYPPPVASYHMQETPGAMQPLVHPQRYSSQPPPLPAHAPNALSSTKGPKWSVRPPGEPHQLPPGTAVASGKRNVGVSASSPAVHGAGSAVQPRPISFVRAMELSEHFEQRPNEPQMTSVTLGGGSYEISV